MYKICSFIHSVCVCICLKLCNVFYAKSNFQEAFESQSILSG